MEIYSEINGFKPANTTSILQSRDQRVILTFKSYYLRNKLPKAIAATGSDSSDETGPFQPKIFLTGFTILEGVENILDSWEEVKIPMLRVWKKLVPTLMDDFEGFKTSVEEATVHVVKIENQNQKWNLNM